VLSELGAQRDVELARAAAAGRDGATAAGRGEAGGERRAPAEPSELTPRELDVLRLVAQGLSDPEIAERLIVSPHTVHRHVANVRTKLCLPSRAAAVGYAARSGLL
jgi:DNA-binding NarL/FixJ family response regulator